MGTLQADPCAEIVLGNSYKTDKWYDLYKSACPVVFTKLGSVCWVEFLTAINICSVHTLFGLCAVLLI